MIKATKPKLKRKNPKTFKEAILETVDRNIVEQKKLIKEQNGYTNYFEAPVILEVLKVLKHQFKSGDNSTDYSNNVIISTLRQIIKELKSDVHEYTEFD